MTVIMRGKEVATRLREEVIEEVKSLRADGVKPTAAIVRVGDLSDSVGYERSAVKVLKKAELEVETFYFPEETTENQFLSEFEKINSNKDIHGILLLRPLPDHIDIEKVKMIIDPAKDIDGMSPYNIGKVLEPHENDFVPCTPAAVMETLKHYGIELQGKDVAVVGHSLVVGRPLSMLLASQDATISLCHIHTKDMKGICQNADIIVTATGAVGLITGEHVKEGAVVIDVGTTYDENGKLHGDVRFDEVEGKASHLTPVPGGIGAVTTTILAKRVVIAARQQMAGKEGLFAEVR